MTPNQPEDSGFPPDAPFYLERLHKTPAGRALKAVNRARVALAYQNRIRREKHERFIGDESLKDLVGELLPGGDLVSMKRLINRRQHLLVGRELIESAEALRSGDEHAKELAQEVFHSLRERAAQSGFAFPLPTPELLGKRFQSYSLSAASATQTPSTASYLAAEISRLEKQSGVRAIPKRISIADAQIYLPFPGKTGVLPQKAEAIWKQLTLPAFRALKEGDEVHNQDAIHWIGNNPGNIALLQSIASEQGMPELVSVAALEMALEELCLTVNPTRRGYPISWVLAEVPVITGVQINERGYLLSQIGEDPIEQEALRSTIEHCDSDVVTSKFEHLATRKNRVVQVASSDERKLFLIYDSKLYGAPLQVKPKEVAGPQEAVPEVIASPVAQTAESERSPFERRIVSDQIIKTFSLIREQVKRLNIATTICVPITIEGAAEEAQDQEGVPAEIALSLIASAKVAQNWKEVKDDPIRAGMEEVQRILATLPATGNIDIDELFREDHVWGALASLTTQPEAVELLEATFPNSALQSEKKFVVEALPNSDEDVQLASIVKGLIKRLRELCGSSIKFRDYMQHWEAWTERIRTADISDIPQIHSISESQLIPPAKLLQLNHPFPETRAQAKKYIQQHGGYTRRPDDEELRWMVEKCLTHIVYDDPEDSETAFGYSAIITDPIEVRKQLTKMFGYEAGKIYDPSNLPTTTPDGWRPHPFRKDHWANMLNAADSLAMSVEIAIRNKELADKPQAHSIKKKLAAATALKRFSYSGAIEEKKTHGLVRYFTISHVNGHRVDDTTNIPSSRFTEALGGTLIGGSEEDYELDIGGGQTIKLTLFWNYSYFELQHAVDIIDGAEEKGT